VKKPSAGGERGRRLTRLAGPGERQAGNDTVGERGTSLGETLPGGLPHRPNALLETNAHIGGTSHTFAEDRTSPIGKARAAPGATAVNSEKK
jgi:hypothetical protein